MDTCDQCREQIWDDLFGLLEAGDRARLRQHVAACSICQAEMATAREQHRLVTEAARLEVEVPPFTAPPLETVQSASPSPRLKTAAVKRRVPGLPWLAMAAAILLLIALPYALYQYGRFRHEVAWRAAADGVAQIVKERDELQSRAQTEREQLVQAARANHLHLQAVGPAVYQLGAVNPYRVWVSDLDGHPVDAPLTARLLDGDKPLILDPKKSGHKGEWLVELPTHPSLPAESTPRLELAARGQGEVAPLQTYLRVLEPAYRTHLATDKAIYHAGDTIFFRSLTLERFGLRAPDCAFTAVYTLTDAQGKDVRTLRGLTRGDGIGGGEFELTAGEPAGEYTLTVAEANHRFSPVRRRLWVGPIASEPHKANSPDRGLEVEFFPEGGDLVAGLETRVYFRVRNSQGQAVDLQGTIVDSHDRDVAAVQTFRLERQPELNCGLGVFTLQPQVGETYRLRVTSPQGVEIRAVLPAVQATGLALRLPAAVGGSDEPIRAILHQNAPRRNLVVGLFCHGRLVAQELVGANTESTEVRLTPAADCSGIMRITVFEERDGQLRPLAERLTYRRPDRRLVLSVKSDKESHAPGETVQCNIRSLNEKGMAEPAWLLVSVVDQAALSGAADAADASLPTYFQFLSELDRPEDIERADVLLSDGPEAAAALDLYLGTQGWRRFVEPPAETTLVRGTTGATPRAQDCSVPAIAKLDNREQVERHYDVALSEASANLNDSLTRLDDELAREGAERLQAARAAAQELDRYLQRAGELLRLATVLSGIALFTAGCLLLSVALLRFARGLADSRGYLTGAFAALLLCVLILWQPVRGWGRNSPSIDQSRIAAYAEKLDRRLDRAALALPSHQGRAPATVLSKRRGPLSQEAWGKQVARIGSHEAEEPNQRREKPSSVAPDRRPRIGIIRAAPRPESPTSLPSDKNAQPAPLPLRSYAYFPPSGATSRRQSPETILWQPVLFSDHGTAEVTFALPARAASYRIRIQGHTAEGRLGAVEEKLSAGK